MSVFTTSSSSDEDINPWDLYPNEAQPATGMRAPVQTPKQTSSKAAADDIKQTDLEPGGTDFSQKTWPQTFYHVVSSAPEIFRSVGRNLATAVSNPVETGQNLLQLGQGAILNASSHLPPAPAGQPGASTWDIFGNAVAPIGQEQSANYALGPVYRPDTATEAANRFIDAADNPDKFENAASYKNVTDAYKRQKAQELASQFAQQKRGVYGDLFNGASGLKNELWRNPENVLMDAAFVGAPVLRGLGSAAELSGMPSVIQQGARGAANVVQHLDPAQAALSIAKSGVQAVPGAVKNVQSALTGVPSSFYGTAAKAGLSDNAEYTAEFNKFITGKGNAVEIAKEASDALAARAAAESSSYLAQRRAINADHGASLSYDNVNQSIIDSENRYGGRSATYDPAQPPSEWAEEAQATNKLRQLVDQWSKAPQGSWDHSIEGFDNHKQSLFQMAENAPTEGAKNIYMSAYHSLKNTIVEADPRYAALMEKYQEGQRFANDIAKTTGVGTQAAATAITRKLINSSKNSLGQNLLDELLVQNPKLQYMLAGAALNSMPAAGKTGVMEAVTAPLMGLAGATLSSGPDILSRAAIGAGIAGTQFVAQSPHIQGRANYYAGKIARPAVAAGKVVAPVVDNPVTRAAARAATSAPASYMGYTAANPNLNFFNWDAAPAQQSSGGRIDRKSGGKVSNDAAHNHLVARLMSLAEKAKRGENATTKPLLNAPDEAIVKALGIANAAI